MGKEILTNKEKILDGARRIDDTILDGAKRVADDALGKVSGGGIARNPNLAGGVQRHFCKKCNKDTAHIVYSGGRLVCEICGTSPTL